MSPVRGLKKWQQAKSISSFVLQLSVMCYFDYCVYESIYLREWNGFTTPRTIEYSEVARMNDIPGCKSRFMFVMRS